MKAAEAKRLTKNATNAHNEQRRIKAAEETRKRKEADALYMRTEYAKFEAKVYDDIRKAAKRMITSITISDPPAVAWKYLEPILREDGYNITSHFIEGSYTDMGDFNAPCNVWTDPYWSYTVSW